MPPLTPSRARAVHQFTSPAVRRAHRNAALPSPPSTRTRKSRKRRFSKKKYMGPRLARDPTFIGELLRVAREFPLCRMCLQVVGNICEHSHPHEADPLPGEVPARALTACAGCNADERESLRLTCQQYGAHLRGLHVSKWPLAAQTFQSAELARRVSLRKAGRQLEASPLKPKRAFRILKFGK